MKTAPRSGTTRRSTCSAGAAAPAPRPAEDNAPYTVLARKYRPRNFDDLIGQEGMVRTLKNAFASGRIAHAFMLTGVRGVGKTTTARLLARALNYESDTVHGPSVADLAVEGRHCKAIIDGRHLDVLELDAASRTKVDDMRELLEGVRYAPAEARYKVYVIDEVHMLSTNAFNALLKTLEEPPPHAKFIFATTEIRKVPVTILSRCQRFDLRRVEPEVIVANLSAIAKAEAMVVDDDALMLIARAAEGSVRDAQSLLDQAMVQGAAGDAIGADLVRDMLGLADRAQSIALFEMIARGDAEAAIPAFRALYAVGADPATVMLDLLEHCHAASVARTIGAEALTLPRDQAARLAALGASLSAGSLARLWQMLLKGLDEVRRGARSGGGGGHGADPPGLCRRPAGSGGSPEVLARRRARSRLARSASAVARGSGRGGRGLRPLGRPCLSRHNRSAPVRAPPRRRHPQPSKRSWRWRERGATSVSSWTWRNMFA